MGLKALKRLFHLQHTEITPSLNDKKELELFLVEELKEEYKTELNLTKKKSVWLNSGSAKWRVQCF